MAEIEKEIVLFISITGVPDFWTVLSGVDADDFTRQQQELTKICEERKSRYEKFGDPGNSNKIQSFEYKINCRVFGVGEKIKIKFSPRYISSIQCETTEKAYNKVFMVSFRDFLDRNNMTQAELAGKTGLKKALISAWANGRSVPPYDKMILLTNAGMTLNDIFYFGSNPVDVQVFLEPYKITNER